MKKNDAQEEPKKQDEAVGIEFDFTRVDLWEFFDLMEASASSQEQGAKPADIVKLIKTLRSAFVSSSRPLTVADLEMTISSFWKSAELFKSPNNSAPA